MIRNTQKKDDFRAAWKREQYRLKDIIAKGTKVPEKPGLGWLQGEAAHYDLCTALFKDDAGNPVVCGNPVGGNLYYCPQCVELLGKLTK